MVPITLRGRGTFAQMTQVSERSGLRAEFVAAMAEVASPVALITTGTLADPRGLTASAVCSLSADPPAILVCLNKNASVHEAVLHHRHFAANFLGARHDGLAMRFASKEADRFADEKWVALETGAPILRSALVAFDCSLHAVLDGFSHSILVGKVERIVPAQADYDPNLVWHRRRFCRTVDL